jgi:hypothetical protein
MSVAEDSGHGAEKIDVLRGPRVGVGTDKFVGDAEAAAWDETASTEDEEGHDIKYRTLTWQKVTIAFSPLKL